MTLDKAISQYMIQHKMTRRGDLLVVAVSGGNDSVALLHLLEHIRHKMGYRLHVAHYDHRLRKESATDADFVKCLSARYGLPFTLGQRLGKGLAQLSEDKARQLRLAFLVGLARKLKAAAVVTAHHKDDLAETVLMRLIRGSGLAGLRAMTPIGQHDEVNFIRPFLGVDRRALEAYAKKERLSVRVDKTNESLDFLRNRIRHELIPLLSKAYNPAIVQSLSQLASISQDDYDVLNQVAQGKFKRCVKIVRGQMQISLDDFNTLMPSMKRMVLRLCLAKLCSNLNMFNFEHIDQLIRAQQSLSEGSVHLPQNVKGKFTKKYLILSR